MTFHELGGGLQYNDDQYLPTRFDLSLITQMTSLFFRNNSPLMKEITLIENLPLNLKTMNLPKFYKPRKKQRPRGPGRKRGCRNWTESDRDKRKPSRMTRTQ